MRRVVGIIVVGLAASGLLAAQGDNKVEVKGPHICCKQCVRIVGQILKDVPGVSEVNASIPEKNVTFTAKDSQAAAAGVKALIDGGFFGTATQGGKAVKVSVPTVEKGKADVVAVKNVHVCCGQCQKAINQVFKTAKVSYSGEGAQRTVRIESPGLDRSAVVEALHKAGFHGTVEK